MMFLSVQNAKSLVQDLNHLHNFSSLQTYSVKLRITSLRNFCLQTPETGVRMLAVCFMCCVFHVQIGILLIFMLPA